VTGMASSEEGYSLLAQRANVSNFTFLIFIFLSIPATWASGLHTFGLSAT
jgi:hypothetical protein